MLSRSRPNSFLIRQVWKRRLQTGRGRVAVQREGDITTTRLDFGEPWRPLKAKIDREFALRAARDTSQGNGSRFQSWPKNFFIWHEWNRRFQAGRGRVVVRREGNTTTTRLDFGEPCVLPKSENRTRFCTESRVRYQPRCWIPIPISAQEFPCMTSIEPQILNGSWSCCRPAKGQHNHNPIGLWRTMAACKRLTRTHTQLHTHTHASGTRAHTHTQHTHTHAHSAHTHTHTHTPFGGACRGRESTGGTALA